MGSRPTFVRCAEPLPGQLAINNHRAFLDAYAGEMRGDRDRWAAAEQRAEDVVDTGGFQLAHGLRCVLDAAININLEPTKIGPDPLQVWPSPFAVEAYRRAGFGALAISSLSRLLINPDDVIGDGDALGRADLLMDVAGQVVPDTLPTHYKIHMRPDAAETILPAAEAPDEWFRLGDLFVRRTVEAQPSIPLMEHAAEQATAVEWGDLVTLHPYMATRI